MVLEKYLPPAYHQTIKFQKTSNKTILSGRRKPTAFASLRYMAYDE